MPVPSQGHYGFHSFPVVCLYTYEFWLSLCKIVRSSVILLLPLFAIVNFPFLCSNIPAAPAYGVYISQLIRNSRACGSYHDFLDRGLLLTRKVLNQGFLVVKLKSLHRNLTVAIITWLTVAEYACHKISRICSVHRNHNPILSSVITGFETRAGCS